MRLADAAKDYSTARNHNCWDLGAVGHRYEFAAEKTKGLFLSPFRLLNEDNKNMMDQTRPRINYYTNISTFLL